MVDGAKYEFRISKYNRVFGQEYFLDDDWTSISDIGKVFKGKVLTYSAYEHVENQYLLLISKICSELNVSKMRVTNLENYFNLYNCRNRIVLKSIDEIISVARDCLREKYWCKLTSKTLSFHFGYDYYLYVCSPLDYQFMSCLVRDCGLFIEIKKSPYNT